MQSEYLEPKLFKKVWAAMPKTASLAVRLSLETGMRVGDVLALTPDRLGRDSVRFTAQKTGKDGVAKISPRLARELRDNASCEWVFPGKKPGQHLTRQAVYQAVKRACAMLGIEGQISPHSARKTFAVVERKAHGLTAVKKALQHDSVETTKIYAYSDLVELDGVLAEVRAIHADVRRVYEMCRLILNILE